MRDSSLSACIQAVVAAEVGHLELAYDYFGEAALLDLGDIHHNTKRRPAPRVAGRRLDRGGRRLRRHAGSSRLARLRAAPSRGARPARLQAVLQGATGQGRGRPRACPLHAARGRRARDHPPRQRGDDPVRRTRGSPRIPACPARRLRGSRRDARLRGASRREQRSRRGEPLRRGRSAGASDAERSGHGPPAAPRTPSREAARGADPRARVATPPTRSRSHPRS